MKRGNTLLLACLMAVGLSTTAFAEEPQTVVNTENGGASISITDITPREEQEDETESSFQTRYYPIAIETAEDAGVHINFHMAAAACRVFPGHLRVLPGGRLGKQVLQRRAGKIHKCHKNLLTAPCS